MLGIWDMLSPEVQHSLWVLGFGFVGFFVKNSIYNIAFVAISLALIFVVRFSGKQDVFECKWWWIGLICMEVCALVISFISGHWWMPVTDYLEDTYACVARFAGFLYIAQLAISVILWRRLRNKALEAFDYPK